MVSAQIGDSMLSVPSFIRKYCKRRHVRETCCRGSRLRGEGIKKTVIPGVYFADADLECSEGCFGLDSDTIYDWTLTPNDKSNPGNLRIVGDSRKVGNDRVQVTGTGAFDLSVTVTFKCRDNFHQSLFAECIRTATVRFTL